LTVQLFSEERSQNETGILFEAVSKLKTEKPTYAIDDIIFEVGQNKSKAKWNVINKLEALKETGILSDNATSINELIQDGRASIMDMKGVNPDLQSMIVAKLCGDLFNARKLNIVPPMMLVLEEAHNFCPEKGFGGTVSSDILRTIASEGRKFGLGLMVVSQRPARVDKNILSQCNTQIIMKVTNPNDLQAISKGLEGISSDVVDDIKRLSPGVAMIVSTYIERPILVDIRTRKSKHGGASVPIVKAPIMEPGEKPRTLTDISNKINEASKTIVDASKAMIEAPRTTIMETPKTIIDKARKIMDEPYPQEKQKEEREIKPVKEEREKKPAKEEKKKRTKSGMSLYNKMFGSRNK